MTRRSPLLPFAVLAFAIPGASRAQVSATAASPAAPCDYRACALGIVPNWSGLAVVRGAGGPRVANLSFFWPRDVSAALRGPHRDIAGADSAAAQARRAVQLRRGGAALTDAGIVLGTIAAIRVLSAGRVRRADGMIAGTGAIALGLSVPFQFAADGALSRAVWWHNVRFAR